MTLAAAHLCAVAIQSQLWEAHASARMQVARERTCMSLVPKNHPKRVVMCHSVQEQLASCPFPYRVVRDISQPSINLAPKADRSFRVHSLTATAAVIAIGDKLKTVALHRIVMALYQLKLWSANQ